MEILARYLDSRKYLLENRRFTSMDKLLEYLQDHSVDVLLLGQEVELERLPSGPETGKVIVLSEGKLVGENDVSVIFKYQSAEKILQEIFALLAEKTDYPDFSTCAGKQTEFVCFYSPSGVLEGLWQKLYANRSGDGSSARTLLVNLNLFDGRMDCSGQEPVRGISDLLFYIRQRKEKTPLKLQSLVQRQAEFDYLPAASDCRDLYSLQPGDVDFMLRMFAGKTPYERVYFETGFLSEAVLHLFCCCNCIYLPAARTQWERNQQSAWKGWMVREGMEDVIKQIRYLHGLQESARE